jgi:hypothetical protein
VISNENVNTPVRPLGLFLEPHEKIHALSRITAPVNNISHLDEVRFASDPVKLFIDNPGVLQVGHKVCVSTMDIANRQDTLHIIPLPPDRLCRSRRDCLAYENNNIEYESFAFVHRTSDLEV